MAVAYGDLVIVRLNPRVAAGDRAGLASSAQREPPAKGARPGRSRGSPASGHGGQPADALAGGTEPAEGAWGMRRPAGRAIHKQSRAGTPHGGRVWPRNSRSDG